MNTSFLLHVANSLKEKFGNDLSRTAVVFPNKRAALFMNKYLACKDEPIWSPAYITISDLFRQKSSRTVADNIQLVCMLYNSFCKITHSSETLDHFFGWGQMLLADFDDVDKNMADAQQLFSNLEGLHGWDSLDFLTVEQKALLMRFFSNMQQGEPTELKQKFKELWNKLYDIYTDFNQELQSKGLAYEGALYREVAQSSTLTFEYDHYAFVGFNMVQKVEKRLFKRLMSEKKAVFYWDFDKYYMDRHQHEAGTFIKRYLEEFPNELDNGNRELYNQFETPKEITFLAATTENIQARYMATWLRENGRMEAQEQTAVVLCDENLLTAVIHNIPQNEGDVNITTGYPLAQAPVSSLVHTLVALQTLGYHRKNNAYRRTYVNTVLRHPYLRYVSDAYVEMYKTVNKERSYYVEREAFANDEGLALIFADIDTARYADEPYNLRLLDWLSEILKRVGRNSVEANEPFLQESVFRMYTLLNRLKELTTSGELHIQTDTLQRLMRQLIGTTSIPFHGEPAKGIQLMGVLETRNLDFEHVLILSCNEGNMPKGVNDASFIPHALRRAFELTTVENKVGIYAYYFHRLLQRAKDITIVYNRATEDGNTGEMSRFMLQLMVESNHKIKRKILQAAQNVDVAQTAPIEKNAEVMSILDGMTRLSPTAINTYLLCPMKFYYRYVAGIEEPLNDDDDEIDNRTFGNIFHMVMQNIYELLTVKSRVVSASVIENFLKDVRKVELMVDEAFAKIFFHSEKAKRKITYNGLQLINKKVITELVKRQLKIDMNLGTFEFLKAEVEVNETLNIKGKQLTVGGTIDRLDKIVRNGQETIRVIDYKTGKEGTSYPVTVDEIFNPKNIISKHANYYLQTILYALVVSGDKQLNREELPVSPALLFIQSASTDKDEDYDPTLKLGKSRLDSVAELKNEFMEHLEAVIASIFSKEHAFAPTAERKNCERCAYKTLCNR